MNLSPYRNFLEAYPDTTVLFGDDVRTAWCELLLARQTRSAVLFTGRHSADRTGNFGRFAALAAELPVEFNRFTAIPAEPDIPTIRAMVEFLEKKRPDTVIALGGGSAMDAAKAAYLSWQTGCDVTEFFGSDRALERFKDRALDRVICFPTTAGTGSEVTLYSNIVDRERGVKKLISDPLIIPQYSFVMPSMMADVPVSVRRATGCDALAHLTEGFLNIIQDQVRPDVNRWAKAGIGLIVENLPKVLAKPTPDSIAAMAMASTLGGMVIRFKSTGLPHLCSFSWFGRIEHGTAAAMLIPASWRYYLGREEVAAKTMELAEFFPGETPAEVVASFRNFLTRCGVAPRLAAYPDLTPELFEKTARSAEENPMKLKLAPRPVEPKDAYQVIKTILAES